MYFTATWQSCHPVEHTESCSQHSPHAACIVAKPAKRRSGSLLVRLHRQSERRRELGVFVSIDHLFKVRRLHLR